jgi:hypothetical protein
LKAVYVLRKPVVYKLNALTSKAGTYLNLVHSESRVAALLVFKQEVVDQGVLKSNRLEEVFKDVNDRMQIMLRIKEFIFMIIKQQG